MNILKRETSVLPEMKTLSPGELEESKEMNSSNNLLEFRNTFFPTRSPDKSTAQFIWDGHAAGWAALPRG